METGAWFAQGPPGQWGIHRPGCLDSVRTLTRELRLQAFVRAILLLDTDRAGTIYLATLVEQPDSSEVVLLNCLEPLKGVVVGSAVLPPNTLPEETFRDFTVLDEGGVIYALRTEQGVSYLKYDCE
jgi:hypothetical protein